MRREDKKKLTINRRIIVNHLLDLEGVLDYLISKQIFTPAIRERIIYESRVPSDRIRHMLDYLITRNALSFQYFLESLCLTGNTDIANILEPDYSSSEQCRLMLEREKIPARQHLTPNNQSYPDHSNLPYPITCTQNHTVYSNDVHSSNSLLNRFLLNSNHCTSRSASSSCQSTSSSSSMSPVINRVRSSSVTALRLNRNINSSNFCTPNRLSYTHLENHIENSPDRSLSPFNRNNDGLTNTPQPPSTYNIDWNDVNNLELDFTVYKTMPNLRKQLTNDECYQMEQVPRGLCLIINNEHFYDSNGIEINSMRRYGTDMDASRLKNLFEKLNFQVEMFVDLKEIEMRQVISLFADKSESNSSQFDAICLIILSHGTDGYVYGVDYENKINMDKDILNIFDDILIGKPKLFIFQACRGEHLNQKDFTFQSSVTTLSHSITSPVLSSNVTSTQAASSKSFCGSAINSSKNILEEDTIRRFKQLKMSSLTSGTLQLMYKKKSSNTINTSNTGSTTSNNSTQINSQSVKHKKTRSRSHSRSKYSSYLVSAASAIKTAIKTSPSSTKTIMASISTQTHSSSSSSSSCSIQINESQAEQEASSCYLLNNNILASNMKQSMANFIDGRPIKTSLPSRSDFFIWYSSVRGFVSHRDIDGSPFIKCLVTVFSRCSYELELIEMVRKVNYLMQQYEKKHFDERNAIASYFMVPVAEFHLTKRLYFNP